MAKTNYWFKAKKYGYGWYPSNWQGWSILISFIILLTISAFLFSQNNIPLFLVETFILTMILVFISYKKGEKIK